MRNSSHIRTKYIASLPGLLLGTASIPSVISSVSASTKIIFWFKYVFKEDTTLDIL